MKVFIVGTGLSGCEAAWQLASRGIEVEMFEMRDDTRKTFAHQTKNCAELVCSNSLRSDDVSTAIGLLHEEMRQLDSLIMRAADANKIPAGSALAVDREGFSQFIENALLQTGKVKITRREITELPADSNEKWLVATGPLTSDSLSKSILHHSGEEHLAFFDAIAPIIFKDSIDMSIAWRQSRYDKKSDENSAGDYINCPMNKEQYLEFVNDLRVGEKTDFKEWEKNTPYFNGCLPIEVMAERGEDTLRYGPMKPVGLTNPHISGNAEPQLRIAGNDIHKKTQLLPLTSSPLAELGLRVPGQEKKDFSKARPGKCYAVVQLRQDNKLDTLYNMVGFQTKLKYGEQQRIFRKIPGLEKAEFARLGGIHRNTFINSPKLLDEFMRFKKLPHISFVGQVTGVEGYVESAAMGLLRGIFLAHEIAEKKISTPTHDTAIGALLNHITVGHTSNDFQPMNVNFGLFKPLEEKIKKSDRKDAYSDRALQQLKIWKENL